MNQLDENCLLDLLIYSEAIICSNFLMNDQKKKSSTTNFVLLRTELFQMNIENEILILRITPDAIRIFLIRAEFAKRLH